jgi:uncharacterized membrane protein
MFMDGVPGHNATVSSGSRRSAGSARQITDQIPDQVIAWESVDGTERRRRGSNSRPDQTR